MRTLPFIFAFLLVFSLTLHVVSAVECGQTPTDHCTISASTTFTPGNYQVENITIIANDTLVDCNGASFSKPGAIPLFQVRGTEGVTIKNCYASDYGKVITNDLSLATLEPVKTLTIRDNNFDSIGGIAIYLRGRITNLSTGQDDPFPNIQIINNTILGSYEGIYLINLNNSIIQENTLDVNGAPNYEGVYFAGSSHGVVSGNILTGGKIHTQIQGRVAVNTTIENNIRFYNNRLTKEATASTAVASHTLDLRVNNFWIIYQRSRWSGEQAASPSAHARIGFCRPPMRGEHTSCSPHNLCKERFKLFTRQGLFLHQLRRDGF